MKKAFIVFATCFIALATSAQSVNFESFLQQFPKATLPYTLGEDVLRGQLEQRAASLPLEKAKPLAWEYYEFIPTLEDDARENRMPVYPEPVAAFETEQYHAVIYNTGRNFARQYKTYNITVFDKSGKFVTTRSIAGVNPTAMATATIDSNLNVTIKEYSVNWSKDYLTNGIVGNSITSIIEVGTRTVDAKVADKAEGDDWKNQPAKPGKSVGPAAQAK